MEQNIAYPSYALRYEHARGHLEELAQPAGVNLQQSYASLVSRLALQDCRYAHAKQFKRMCKALERLKGYTCRVMRKLRRQLDDIPAGTLRDWIIATLALVPQLLHHQPEGGNKIYSLDEPEVDCISKDSVRVRHGFGSQVSVAATLDEGFVVGMRSFPGNPYVDYMLRDALGQVETFTDQRPELAVIDRGYRGASRR